MPLDAGGSDGGSGSSRKLRDDADSDPMREQTEPDNVSDTSPGGSGTGEGLDRGRRSESGNQRSRSQENAELEKSQQLDTSPGESGSGRGLDRGENTSQTSSQSEPSEQREQTQQTDLQRDTSAGASGQGQGLNRGEINSTQQTSRQRDVSPGGSGTGQGLNRGETQTQPRDTSPGGSGTGQGLDRGDGDVGPQRAQRDVDREFGSDDTADDDVTTTQRSGFSLPSRGDVVQRTTSIASLPASAARNVTPSVSEVRESDEVQGFLNFQEGAQRRVSGALAGVRDRFNLPDEPQITSDIQDSLGDPQSEFESNVQEPAQTAYRTEFQEPAREGAYDLAEQVTQPESQAAIGAVAAAEPTPLGEAAAFGATAAASAVVASGSELDVPEDSNPFQQRPELNAPDNGDPTRSGGEIAVPEGGEPTRGSGELAVPDEGELTRSGGEISVPEGGEPTRQSGEIGVPSLRAGQLRGRQAGREVESEDEMQDALKRMERAERGEFVGQERGPVPGEPQQGRIGRTRDRGVSRFYDPVEDISSFEEDDTLPRRGFYTGENAVVGRQEAAEEPQIAQERVTEPQVTADMGTAILGGTSADVLAGAVARQEQAQAQQVQQRTRLNTRNRQRTQLDQPTGTSPIQSPRLEDRSVTDQVVNQETTPNRPTTENIFDTPNITETPPEYPNLTPPEYGYERPPDYPTTNPPGEPNTPRRPRKLPDPDSGDSDDPLGVLGERRERIDRDLINPFSGE